MRCGCLRRNRSPSRSVRSGFTLMEVAVSIALLAALLASILVAFGKHARQISNAQEQLEAAAALDAVISQWWREPLALQSHANGLCGPQGQFRWQATYLRSAEAEELGAVVIRWEAFAATGGAALVKVDVLHSQREPEKPDQP